MPVSGGTTLKLSNAVWPQRRNVYRSRFRSYSRAVLLRNASREPKSSTWTEWSMTSSTGCSGLIRFGSPPRRVGGGFVNGVEAVDREGAVADGQSRVAAETVGHCDCPWCRAGDTSIVAQR